METTVTPAPPRKATLNTLLLFLVPLLVLAGVIALFVSTNGAGLNVKPAAPLETVQFARTILRPDEITFHVQNTSPQDLTIAQIAINDAFWPFTASPRTTIPRLGTAVFTLHYPWVEGETYAARFISSTGIAFETVIPVATTTATASPATLWSFTLIGLYVGIIPVFLGLFWFPALRRLGRRSMMFLMGLTAGLLLFLGIDATNEALEVAGEVGSAFQGVGLVGLSIAVTFLLLDAITRRQVSVGRSEVAQRATVAFMIAIGIGLHNLGEGLAIGAAYSVGAAVLGAFLVIGFILQNITEGLGIIAPIVKDKPSLRSLALMGLVAGAPAIIGAWVGGLTYARPLAVVFLGIGAGAVFEVAYEIAKLIRKDAVKRPMPLTIVAGVTAGMLMLYGTGVLIK